MTSKNIEVAWWAADAIADQKANGFFVHAGLGAGKTFGIWQWLYSRQILNKRCKAPIYWFVMPTHGKVQDTAIPKWYIFAETLGLREGEHFYLYESRPYRLILKNANQLITTYFHSGDRPNLMVGTEIAGLAEDEAGELKFEVFERGVTRLRDKSADVLQYMIGGAPQGMTWFADYANFTGYNAKRKVKSYEVWTDDNLHNLPSGYIENQLMPMIEHNPAKVASWRYGKFTNFFEGSAYTDLNPYYFQPVEPHQSSPIILAWDNNAPLAWVAMQERRGDTQMNLAITRESRGTARLLVDACVDFITQFEPSAGWKDTPIIIEGDAALHSPSVRTPGSGYEEIIKNLKQVYSNVTLTASRYNPLQEIRVESVNRAFSYNRIIINPKCEKTIRSFQRAAWKKDGSRELAKPSGEDVNAYSDAAGYYIVKWIGQQLNRTSAQNQRTILL